MRVRHLVIVAGIGALSLSGMPGAGFAQQGVEPLLVQQGVEPPLAQEGAAPVPTQEPPPPLSQVVVSLEATELLEAALGGVDQQSMALAAKGYFFPSLQGGTLMMLGFEMGKDGLMFGLDAFGTATPGAPAGEVAKMELFGALLQGGTEVRRLGGPFSIARESGDDESTGVHSFGDTVAPGSYELVWGVRDTISGVAATRRDALEVPDFTASGLTTSSVMVVTGYPSQALGSFQPNTVYEGVRVLTASFPESLDRELVRAEDLMLTYIISGARFDGATQGFNLELTYRILDASGESIWRVPPQSLTRPTVGQPIPLAQIGNIEVGGEYSFEINVKDMSSGAEIQTVVPFRIVG